MTCACRVCESSLREDFGFEHIMWVYSGRRGVHCWVGDAESRKLTNEARLAIIKYFSVVGGNENSAKKTDLQAPLHPSLERAYKLEPSHPATLHRWPSSSPRSPRPLHSAP